MVLRDSYSSRCGCLAIVEETEPGAVGRICIPHPRRNCIDQEAISGRTHKARTLLVLETMEDPEESDSHKCDYVCTDWSLNWSPVEMERAVGCRWIEYRYRTPATDYGSRLM